MVEITKPVLTVSSTVEEIVETFKGLKSEGSYLAFVELLGSGNPVLSSPTETSKLARLLGSRFFEEISWFAVEEPETLARFPIPLLHRIFSEEGSGFDWWDFKGTDFLQYNLLPADVLEQIITDIIQQGVSADRKFGLLVQNVKNAAVLNCLRKVLFEQYGEWDSYSYKKFFLDYVVVNPACTREIALDVLHHFVVDDELNSSYNLLVLEALFNAYPLDSETHLDDSIMSKIMEVYTDRRKLVALAILNKTHSYSMEFKVDMFVKYYSPLDRPFLLVGDEYATMIEPVIAGVKERLYADAQTLFPGVNVNTIPLNMIVESTAYGDSEGYKYLLELEEWFEGD